MKTRLTFTLLFLLATPMIGFGQQAADSSFASLVAAAQQAQAVHDYIAAANAYRQALNLQPNLAELWANLGLMEQENGSTTEAISSFQHANRLNASLYVPNLFLGIDYNSTGKATEAIPFLKKAEKGSHTDPEPRLELGRAYSALGKYSLAALEFKQAIGLNPKLSSAWFALGIAYLDQIEADSRDMSTEDASSSYVKALFAESLDKQSRFPEAIRTFKSAIEIEPQPPCLHSELGWALLKQENLPDADSEFNSDQEASPSCALSALGQARVAIVNSDNNKAITLLKKLWGRDQGFVKTNIATLMDGLSPDRISTFKNLLAQQRDATSTELSSLLTAALGGFSAETATGMAVHDARTQSAASPTRVMDSTAASYYQAGEYQRCSDRLQSGKPKAQPNQLLLLTTCSFLTGDYERSSEASAALMSVSPHSVPALYWSIKANEKLAFQALARFEQLEPNSARSHILLGDTLRQRFKYTEALAEYKEAQKIDPTDQAAMLGIALAYLGNNDIDKTIEAARMALLHSPLDPQLNLIMAEALIAQHHYPEAEPYLARSMMTKPQMLPHVHALLGKVYAEEGRTQDAIAQLQMGAESDDDGNVHYQLARLYRQIGDSKRASEALEQTELIQKRKRERSTTAYQDTQIAPSAHAPQ
ncbi:MAG: tetratricopeptide repeat protein [Acidobacteriaceae bacterium]